MAKSPGRGRVRPRSRSRGPASVDVGPKITFPLRPPGSSKNVLKPKSGITVQELERQHAPGAKTLPKEPVKRPDKENVKVATKPTVVPDKDKSEDLPRKTYNLRRRSALPAPEVVEEKIALPPVPVVHNVTDGQFSNAEEDITVHQGEPWTVVDQMSDKLNLTTICHNLTVMQVLGDKENCFKVRTQKNIFETYSQIILSFRNLVLQMMKLKNRQLSKRSTTKSLLVRKPLPNSTRLWLEVTWAEKPNVSPKKFLREDSVRLAPAALSHRKNCCPSWACLVLSNQAPRVYKILALTKIWSLSVAPVLPSVQFH